VTNGPSTDGRRARRERSRDAIIDAAFSLVLDGKGEPTAEQIAERAGVSVSSIFRNFNGLGGMQQHVLDRFRERYSHLLLATPSAGTDLDERIAEFVRLRLDLYEQTNPLLTTARTRAVHDDTWIEPINRNRSLLAEQTRTFFAPETTARTPTEAAGFVALVDSIMSPEVYDLMTRFHARSRRQVSDTWTEALRSLVTTPASAPSGVVS
jgi:AcrR family transcriptional regulator